jgi:hypothetical protein
VSLCELVLKPMLTLVLKLMLELAWAGSKGMLIICL